MDVAVADAVSRKILGHYGSCLLASYYLQVL